MTINGRVVLALAATAAVGLAVMTRVPGPAPDEPARETSGSVASPTASVSEPEILLADQDVAAWTPINNSFSAQDPNRWTEPRNYWEGILFQPGDYLKAYNTTQRMALFCGVTVRAKDKEVRLARSDFSDKNDGNAVRWINIQSWDPAMDPSIDPNARRQPAMSASSIPRLLRDPQQARACDEIDDCVKNPRWCVCLTPPCGPQDLKPGECLRSMQIHGHFVPRSAVITYWQGPNRYRMSAIESQHDPLHNGFKFVLGDKVRVTILRWNGEETTVEDVRSVSLDADPNGGGGTHGIHYDPPW